MPLDEFKNGDDVICSAHVKYLKFLALALDARIKFNLVCQNSKIFFFAVGAQKIED